MARKLRNGLAICLGLFAAAANLGHPAWQGDDCGWDPESLELNPPVVWRYDGCDPGNPTVHCHQGLIGWFYRLGGTDTWGDACCAENEVGEVYFYYVSGELVFWFVGCADPS